jgi:hypothetical protein
MQHNIGMGQNHKMMPCISHLHMCIHSWSLAKCHIIEEVHGVKRCEEITRVQLD